MYLISYLYIAAGGVAPNPFGECFLGIADAKGGAVRPRNPTKCLQNFDEQKITGFFETTRCCVPVFFWRIKR